MTHDKISFTREYCRCRRLDYKIEGESLLLKWFTEKGNTHYYQVCFSLYNYSYSDIIIIINDFCESVNIKMF